MWHTRSIGNVSGRRSKADVFGFFVLRFRIFLILLFNNSLVYMWRDSFRTRLDFKLTCSFLFFNIFFFYTDQSHKDNIAVHNILFQTAARVATKRRTINKIQFSLTSNKSTFCYYTHSVWIYNYNLQLYRVFEIATGLYYYSVINIIITTKNVIIHSIW